MRHILCLTSWSMMYQGCTKDVSRIDKHITLLQDLNFCPHLQAVVTESAWAENVCEFCQSNNTCIYIYIVFYVHMILVKALEIHSTRWHAHAFALAQAVARGPSQNRESIQHHMKSSSALNSAAVLRCTACSCQRVVVMPSTQRVTHVHGA
jgi:hypothetical protein